MIKYLKPYILIIIVVLALTYFQVMADLALPDYMAGIINDGIVGKNSDIIITKGTEMLLVTLLGAAATFTAGFFASRVATGLSRDIRSGVFSKVESFSLEEFDKFSTSSLITRSTNDIQQIQMVTFMMLRMVISAPLMGIGAVVKAYDTAPSMSFVIVLAVMILFILITVIFIIILPKFKMLQKLVDKLNLLARENLTGLRVIRAFTNEEYEQEKFSRTNRDLMNVNLFVNRIMVLMQPLMILLLNLTSIAIIWVGAGYIDSKQINIGDMMAFMQYAMQVIMSFLMLTMIFILLPRASVSFKRISEVLGSHPKIKDPKEFKKFPSGVNGEVEFKNVSFSYPNSEEPVLKNISFKITQGERVAIIGGTGSGKSTLINLIPRFYDVTKGSVLVDAVDIKDVKISELHDKLGYVPQKGVLFSGTIKENIAYPQDPDPLIVTNSAKVAQASDFIEKLDKKYDSHVAQGGSNFSGGQKQRISIARAIAKRSEILIFDDSFSALDFKTDRALRSALEKEKNKATSIVVTQRIGTAMNADRIIVLNEGRMVGIGTHSKLLKECEVYKQIASSQLSKDELKGGDIG